MSVALARSLTKEAYGWYGVVMSIVGVMALSSLPEMSTAIARAVSRGYDGTYLLAIRERVRFSLWGVVAAIILSVYFFVQGKAELSAIFVAVSLTFVFTQVFSSYQSVLLGQKRFGQIAVRQALYSIFTYGITVVVVLVSKSLLAAVTAFFVCEGITNVVFHIRVVPLLRSRQVDAASLGYGKHLTLMDIPGIISAYIDTMLVAYFLSLPDVAVYNVAAAVPPAMNAIFKTVGSVIFPDLSSIKMSEAARYVRQRMSVLLLFGTGVAVAVYLLIPFIIPLFYSRTYEASVPFARIMACGMGISAPGVILTTLLSAQKKTSELYFYRMVLPVISILLCVILTWKWGLLGISYARSLSWILGSVIAFFLVFPPYGKPKR
jgi:O-antigen/teichoic acid export membrane protein